MAIPSQKTNTLWIDSLRRWGQWLGQFPGHCKTGIAGMVAWMMAAGIGLFRWLLTIIGWAGVPSAMLRTGFLPARRLAPDSAWANDRAVCPPYKATSSANRFGPPPSFRPSFRQGCRNPVPWAVTCQTMATAASPGVNPWHRTAL